MKNTLKLFILAMLCLIASFLKAEALPSSTFNICYDNPAIGFEPKLYTNPDDGNEVFIDWGGIEGEPINIGIFNTSGKLYYRVNINQKHKSIDLSNYDLRPGHYIFELTTDRNTYMLKTLVD
jgi:hypothetical protein